MKRLVAFLPALIIALLAPAVADASVLSGLQPQAVTAASGGKVVVGGNVVYGCSPRGTDCEQMVVIARYRRSGALDPTFGHRGIVKLASAASLSGLRSPGDGAVLAVVFAPNPTPQVRLIKLTSSGKRDRKFSNDGVALALSPTDSMAGPSHVCCQVVTPTAAGPSVDPQGRIVVGGSQEGSCEGRGGCVENPLVARLNPDGSRDQSFGNDGIATGTAATGFPVPFARFNALAVDSTGAILLGGTNVSVTPTGTVARFTADGSIDTSFGGGTGAVQTPAPASNVETEPDGRMIYGGAVGDHLYASRLTTSGDVDPSYGEGGFATALLLTSNATDWLDGMASAPNGGVVVGTGLPLTCHGPKCRAGIRLAAFDATGHLDTSFGGGGTTGRNIGPALAGPSYPLPFAMSPISKRLLAFLRSKPTAVAGFLADGQRDAGLGQRGLLSVR